MNINKILVKKLGFQRMELIDGIFYEMEEEMNPFFITNREFLINIADS